MSTSRLSSSVGWKGYINDPDMDDSFHVERGMANARAFLRDVLDRGTLSDHPPVAVTLA